MSRTIIHRLVLLAAETRRALGRTEGSAILEFAIALPLLVVFVVGIYDFSGAFNEKQKIEQAAQEGAIVAGAQPTSDIYVGNAGSTNLGPDSLQPVITAIITSLTGSAILPLGNTGTCTIAGATVTPDATLPKWTYDISGCSSNSDILEIVINRGLSAGGTPTIVATHVKVKYNYHWRFNSVIQLLFPGPTSYLPVTQLIEDAIVHNQM